MLDLDYNSNYNNRYIDDILDLKKEENEMTILILVPNIISLLLVGFLFLHFWFEEECCCGQKKNCLAEMHIVINMCLNIFVGFIIIVASPLDFSYRDGTIDKYNIYFIDSDFQSWNKLNKIIDIYLLFSVVITYILLIIIACYVNRENKMCNMECRFRFCWCCCLCEFNCCTLCTCCDIPPVSVSSTNSLKNQPYMQQQNVLVVQQNEYPINNNGNNADNIVYTRNKNFKNNKALNDSTNLEIPSSTHKIHSRKKKSTNIKKKKNKNTTKNISCIEEKYNNKYNNIPVCTICNIDFKNGENILVLPCEHIFHSHCANSWLKSNNNICPIDGTKIN